MKISLIKKISLPGLIFLFFGFVRGQQYASRWVDMFSYLHIKKMDLRDDRWYVAAQNSVFFYDPQTGETEKFSTVKGLNGEETVTIGYHDATSRTFVSHTDGHIDIITPEGKVLKENGLFLSAIPADKKKIYALAKDGNRFFLAMDFGVAEYDMEQLQFGDTYYIGTGGTEVKVNDILIFNQTLYAATGSQGIKYIDVNEPNKTDFSLWGQIDTGNWHKLFVFNNTLYGVKNKDIYRILPSPVQVYHNNSSIVDVAVNQNYIFVALGNKVLKLDGSFSQIHAFLPTSSYSFKVNTIEADDSFLYIGTQEYGILKIPESGGTITSIHPDSPLYNTPFATDIYDNNIWVVYGDYNELYNPYPLDYKGVSHYVDNRWVNIPYQTFNIPTLTDVKINRSDTTQVFTGSFHKGLVEWRNGQLFQVYDPTNSTIRPIILNGSPYASYRISPLLFDKENHLWMFQGLVLDEVHKYDLETGQWQAYSFSSLMNTAFNEGAADMQFDKSGNLWIATHRLGVVGLNPETGDLVQLTENNNIPYEGGYRNTQATAIDKNNILWIGTLKGLRILRNPERAFSDPQIQAEPIIIELAELHGENNQGEELLNNQQITEIVVDGSNFKWVGTSNAGVFYFNEDGQQTIYHFTKENSPLPGNAIYDISVDPVTGLVLFSTDKGLIGFKGDATEGKNNLDEAYVYPNPVVQKKHERLFIKNIMNDISVKITDVEGNLVYEMYSKGGTASWDLKNFSGRKVSSGVYFILLSDKEHRTNKILKVVIIR